MAKARKKKPVSVARVAYGASSLKFGLVEVADPYAANGEKITVARNLTPLADLASRKKITAVQRLAGERFAEEYERAGIGGAKALDYTREHVDGGPTPEPLTEAQQGALDWLRRAARYPGIGKGGFAVLRAVCGLDKPLSIYAKQVSMSRGGGYAIASRARLEEGYVLLRLIEALDCLVDFLDLLAEGPVNRRRRAESGDNLGIGGDEYEIDRFGDVILKRRA